MTTAVQTKREARIEAVKQHLEAENKHNLDAIMATFSGQPAFALNGAEASGRETVRGLYEGFGFGERGSFSDIQVEIQKWYVGEESITTEMIFRGRHTGEWQGVAATGRAITLPLCAIFTFDAENKVAGERVYFDAAAVLQQIGALS
jgi:steroid delta-isomerase-like uncharacterized protein